MAKRVRRRSTKRSQRRLGKRLTKRRMSKRRLSKRRLSKRRVKRGGNPGEDNPGEDNPGEDYMSQLPQDIIARIVNDLSLDELVPLRQTSWGMRADTKGTYNIKLLEAKKKLDILGITGSDTMVNLENNGAVNDGTIKEILDALTILPNIQTLILSRNGLTTLPSSIGNLPNLQELRLQNNQLTALPSSLGNLPNLITLDLDDNQLTALPESLGNLPNLQTLFLGDNPVTDQNSVVVALREKGCAVIV